MLPLLPPYVINELAHERREGRLPDGRPRYRHDPDQFEYASTALQPDPVYMGLRHMVSNGPIGRLVQWVERWAEAREERAFILNADTTDEEVIRPTIEPLPTVRADAPANEERTAA